MAQPEVGVIWLTLLPVRGLLARNKRMAAYQVNLFRMFSDFGLVQNERLSVLNFDVGLRVRRLMCTKVFQQQQCHPRVFVIRRLNADV